jgi:hypothetical protein
MLKVVNLYLKIKCNVFSFIFSFFSYKIREQLCPGERAGTSGRGEVLGKGG